jgi:hypothetical protein
MRKKTRPAKNHPKRTERYLPQTAPAALQIWRPLNPTWKKQTESSDSHLVQRGSASTQNADTSPENPAAPGTSFFLAFTGGSSGFSFGASQPFSFANIANRSNRGFGKLYLKKLDASDKIQLIVFDNA